MCDIGKRCDIDCVVLLQVCFQGPKNLVKKCLLGLNGFSQQNQFSTLMSGRRLDFNGAGNERGDGRAWPFNVQRNRDNER